MTAAEQRSTKPGTSLYYRNIHVRGLSIVVVVLCHLGDVFNTTVSNR